MPATYPWVRFVDAPVVGATVLLDLHAESAGLRAWPKAEGFSLGTPQVEGSADGVEVSYGDRTISFTEKVRASKTLALAWQSAIARQLLRPDGWLEVTLSATTAPVWFRLRRAEPGDLSFTQVQRDSDSDAWEIPMRLPAEGFAYLERVTQDAVVVANDPSAVSNPCHLVLPPIKGDAPAPLRVKVNPSNSVYMNGNRWMTALHAGDTARVPVLWKIGGADGWAAGDDTSASTVGASTLYTAGTFREVDFDTETDLVTRISGPAPAALPSGRWKVLTRVTRDDDDSTFSLRFGQEIGLGQYVYGDTAVMDRAPSLANGHVTWVDLGEFTFPFGANVPADQQGFAYPPPVVLQVGRLTGAGSARLDGFLLVPVDSTDTRETRTLFSEFHTGGIFINTGEGIWDGDWESFWAYTQFGTLAPIQPELEGQYLRGHPGVENILTILQQVNGDRSVYSDDNPDTLTATTTVTVSYQPRVLWLGDGT